jgi:hypothetical protein
MNKDNIVRLKNIFHKIGETYRVMESLILACNTDEEKCKKMHELWMASITNYRDTDSLRFNTLVGAKNHFIKNYINMYVRLEHQKGKILSRVQLEYCKFIGILCFESIFINMEHEELIDISDNYGRAVKYIFALLISSLEKLD